MKHIQKKFIVTGATGGLGSSIMKSALNADMGLDCIGIARNSFALNRLFKNENVKQITADFSDFEDKGIETLIEYLKKTVTDVGNEIILVLCSGMIEPITKIGNAGNEIFQNIFTNVTSQVYLIDKLVAFAKASGSKVRIIQIDSGAAYSPIQGWALYCSAKAYISMYLRVLKSENPEYKIVLIDPGVLNTKMQSSIRSSAQSDFPNVQTFRRYALDGMLKDPEMVAENIFEHYIAAWECDELMVKLR